MKQIIFIILGMSLSFSAFAAAETIFWSRSSVSQDPYKKQMRVECAKDTEQAMELCSEYILSVVTVSKQGEVYYFIRTEAFKAEDLERILMHLVRGQEEFLIDPEGLIPLTGAGMAYFYNLNQPVLGIVAGAVLFPIELVYLPILLGAQVARGIFNQVRYHKAEKQILKFLDNHDSKPARLSHKHFASLAKKIQEIVRGVIRNQDYDWN